MLRLTWWSIKRDYKREMAKKIKKVVSKVQRGYASGRKPNLESRRVQAVGRLKGRIPDLVDELIAQALPKDVKMRCPHCKKDFVAAAPGRGDTKVLIDLLNRVMGKSGEMLDSVAEMSSTQLNELFRRVVAGRNFKWDMGEAKLAFDAIKNPLAELPAGTVPPTAGPSGALPVAGAAAPLPVRKPAGISDDPRNEAEKIRQSLEKSMPKLNPDDFVEITSW